LWNKTLSERLKENPDYNISLQIPLIGFGSEIEEGNINAIINKIMKEENITFRSFINKSIPELSSEGGLREAFVEIQSLRIIEKTETTMKLNFKLEKGSYATVAIAFLFGCLDTVLKDFP
jgi:tRNA(Glu) U13 pseudouridine synthase TruD